MRTTLLLLLCLLCGILSAKEWRFDLKNNPLDYGGGSVRASLYYDGGIPNVGTFIGHANSTTRDDRVLFRFEISDFYMKGKPVEIKQAFVEFKGLGIYGPIGDRKVILQHCDYERYRMTREDLASDKVTQVMEETPANGKIYHADVTEQLKDDLAHFRFYSMYRVLDTCGLATNPEPIAFGQGIKTFYEGAGDNPVLVVIID